MNIPQLRIELETALADYCEAYDKKMGYGELVSGRLHRGICAYAYCKPLPELGSFMDIVKFKLVYIDATPCHVEYGKQSAYTATTGRTYTAITGRTYKEPYEALLPRIFYLQGILEEIKDLK